jgi:hypothetical protein
VRKLALRYASVLALAGGLAGAASVTTATSASAHLTCPDGTVATGDDPATACAGHEGPAPTTPTTAVDHDHEGEGGNEGGAPTTTRAPSTPTTKATTATTRAPGAPGAVKAVPSFTG